jgi:hypothetical protein
MRRKINLNGSSQESLIEDYRKASKSVDDAIRNICQILPHKRDYQINEHSHEDFEEDRKEHIQIIEDLRQVRDYLNECLVSIGKQ